MLTSTIRVTLFITATAVALTMALTGFGKLIDVAPALKFLKVGFDIPVMSGRWIIYGLAGLELFAGFALAYGNGRRLWPAVVCLALVGLFTGLLVAVRLRHPFVAIHCPCFGALQAPLGGKSILSHLQLNAALTFLLVAYAVLLGIYRRRQRKNMSGSTADSPAEYAAQT
ncbi:MAG: MauE/DoxX family redox-associated membrane protein [Phycisphaerae bacterium]